MYENETYFDHTTYSEEELKQHAVPYDKKADKAARKADKAAKKGAKKAEKAAGKAAKAEARAAKPGRGIVRKVVLSVSLGLCFGLFAGLGFYAVGLATGQFSQADSDSAVLTALPEDVVKLPSETVPADGNAVTTKYVTYVVDDVSEMVEEVMPSMVSIVNNYVSTGMSFWGQTYSEPGVASGSGIIVGRTDEELLIATNNHVVEDAESLEITFIDNTTANADIKGTDPEMDLAVVAVPVSDLSEETLRSISVARLGDSDELKMGMPVVAIGNALGYGQSVTNGIISALDREMMSEDGSTGIYIQTNAAINHGNSGGALLNLSGEVIGINVARIDDNGYYSVEAMGYAIPISAATPIIEELMARTTRIHKVDESERGYMGITMQTVTDEISEMFGFPKGVYVREVAEGSAAEKAGIRVGDIIVKFDGRRISSNTDITDSIQYIKAGETITVTIKRSVDGVYEEYDLEVTLGRRPGED
ncbi:MAG: trypsin-like peptidase domain-containing protein [Butyrivibrio sp.]|nr:trypsin-like peptidase domain-containing protein [Acetatifactor muris]MCM1559901.1 trypsin-like peptidase domain-containing protein [Butyrivibrio sp.]